MYAYSTLRSNCVHFPRELKPTEKGLKKHGDCAVHQAGNLVTILSTNAQPTRNVSVQRQQKNRTRVDIPCPESVALYSRYMGGVVKGDCFVNITV